MITEVITEGEGHPIDVWWGNFRSSDNVMNRPSAAALNIAPRSSVKRALVGVVGYEGVGR